jgi:hypothetical protein
VLVLYSHIFVFLYVAKLHQRDYGSVIINFGTYQFLTLHEELPLEVNEPINRVVHKELGRVGLLVDHAHERALAVDLLTRHDRLCSFLVSWFLAFNVFL